MLASMSMAPLHAAVVLDAVIWGGQLACALLKLSCEATYEASDWRSYL